MFPTNENRGKYYPVQDSCEKEGDPVEKCVYTEGFYFASTLTVVTEEVAVYFSVPGKDSFFSHSYPFSFSETLGESSLGCDARKHEYSLSFRFI